MKQMKMALALVAVLGLSTGAQAATTGTLNLSGTILSLVSIVVTANSAASSLDLTSNQTDLLVGTVSESSNALLGYRIKAKSTNGSKLKHSTAADVVNYTIKYGASASTTLTTVDQVVKTQSTGGAYNNVVSNVTLSYTGSVALTAGSYSDGITFTIEAL